MELFQFRTKQALKNDFNKLMCLNIFATLDHAKVISTSWRNLFFCQENLNLSSTINQQIYFSIFPIHILEYTQYRKNLYKRSKAQISANSPSTVKLYKSTVLETYFTKFFSYKHGIFTSYEFPN